MLAEQLSLPFTKPKTSVDSSYPARMFQLLSSDLDFHGQDSSYASHNFHSFPAKFPPQLPRVFIENLTTPGDVVLDPMMGSGTSVLEAYLHGRRGIGIDIDPLAFLLTKVKVTPLDRHEIQVTCIEIVERVSAQLNMSGNSNGSYTEVWDVESHKVVFTEL